jgi:hypothetical protein
MIRRIAYVDLVVRDIRCHGSQYIIAHAAVLPDQGAQPRFHAEGQLCSG